MSLRSSPAFPLSDGILILDYGSQYTLLIARRIREMGVYSEVWPFHDERLSQLSDTLPMGIILSGGPSSVSAHDSPQLPDVVRTATCPVLGICYGMQLLAHDAGVEVHPSSTREYGRAQVSVLKAVGLFESFEVGQTTQVWMSHGDSVQGVPKGYEAVAQTESGILAAMAHTSLPRFGVQFHPEVSHSEDGARMLESFVQETCGCAQSWNITEVMEEMVERIRQQVDPDARVLCGLSGGVDSSVVAALLHRAIGDRLTCVFVDNGLLRANEGVQVREVFESHFGVDLRVVDARDAFLEDLQGVIDPEDKRKRIGARFIRVFEEAARQVDGAKYLAQGTLFPDVIESISVRGPSATIKSHHNVGGLPEDMKFELVEPLRELFKDEVRALGRVLGLPEVMVGRHPFPGPGLAVRIIGEVTPERVNVVQQADTIFIDMLHEFDLYNEVWQAFAVLLPIHTVGVMGDARTYEQVIALRAVTSTDGMTADRAYLPMEFLGRVSDRIINQVRGVNRVVYDVSSKPPATIEWE